MTDPLEHFDEQQASYELLEEHREMLAREAAEIARAHPDAHLVGVIMNADASEASELRRMLQEQVGRQVAGFVGVMPRKLVLEILRANHPAVLDWLEDSGGGGERRKLPLVAITKNGVRLGCAEYSVD